MWLGPGFGQQHWQYLVMDRKTSFGSFIYSHSSTNPANLVRTGLVDVEVTGLTDTHTHTHTHLMALCLGLPRWASTRKVKPIWILLKQETVSGSGISWAICKSAPCSRQITMSAPHHSVFLQAGCHSCCPTNNVKALKALVTGLTELLKKFK